MILFIFEGKKCEPRLFETLRQLFFQKETEPFVCTYNSNIYSLYSKLKSYDVFDNIGASGNTVTILNEILEERGDNTLENIIEADVSEIFLFFDYDFQESRLTLEANNQHLKEMLEYFNEETKNGKLYINYPMVESIRYVKQLPDNNYWQYTVTRDECHSFKALVQNFSHYDSFDHLLVSNNKNEKEEKKQEKACNARANWIHLIEMNVTKACYICNGQNEHPGSKEDITQNKIYNGQLIKYVNSTCCKVAILNSFPLFLYDYFNVNSTKIIKRESVDYHRLVQD